MPRDYKKVSTRKRKQAGQAPGWVWLLAGLGIGLMVALLVYLKTQRESSVAPTGAPPKAARKHAPTRKPARQRKLRYEFYTILPESEVVIPDQSLPRSGQQPKSATFKAGAYMLQAGSFRRRADAERRKASLALLGIPASIQSVNVNGDTWHRIRIGPFRSLAEINETRRRLKENRINAILVRRR